MPQNRRNNVFRSKQTIKKVVLMFLDVKKLDEKDQCSSPGI